MRESQAIAIVARFSESKFHLSLVDFLIEKGFLTEKQMQCIYQEANLILKYQNGTKRFKTKYTLAECERVIKELGLEDCNLIRNPNETGYLLIDGNCNEGICFRTYRDFIVWALVSPEHPLANGIIE